MRTQSTQAELEKDILDNYKKDGIVRIADRNGRKIFTIRKLAKKLGVIRNTDQKYELLKDEIINLYRSGNTAHQIGRQHNLNRKLITKKLSQWGIQLNSRSESSSIFKFNKNYFKEIDTHEKAYWLGFIYADGCVSASSSCNRLSIALCIKDKEHLEKFARAIESNKQVYDYPHKPNFKSVFCIDNAELVEDLIKLGAHPRKTENLSFPDENQVPDQFLNSFILGFFDGDGCISYTKNRLSISIAGTLPMITSIDRIFIRSGIKSTKYARAANKENGIFYIRKGSSIVYSQRYKTGRRQRYLEQIYNLLYSDHPDYCLRRKKNIFEKLLAMRHGDDWKKHI